VVDVERARSPSSWCSRGCLARGLVQQTRSPIRRARQVSLTSSSIHSRGTRSEGPRQRERRRQGPPDRGRAPRSAARPTPEAEAPAHDLDEHRLLPDRADAGRRRAAPAPRGRSPAIRRAAATAEVTSTSPPTTTTMKLSTTELAYEDELIVTGAVTDADGHPSGRAAVTLVTGDSPARAGSHGHRRQLPVRDRGGDHRPGAVGLKILSDPGSTYIKASEAEPVSSAWPRRSRCRSRTRSPRSSRPCARRWVLLRARQAVEQAPPQGAGRRGSLERRRDRAGRGGLVTNKPTVMSTLRRPTTTGSPAWSRHRPQPTGARGRGLPRLGELEREIRTAADGSFVLEKLAPGEWQGRGRGAGPRHERFGVSIPHAASSATSASIWCQVRERVFQLYRRAAEPALPEPRLWGIWSPRQSSIT